MNVLFLTTEYKGSVFLGGLGTYVNELLSQYDKNFINYTVVLSKNVPFGFDVRHSVSDGVLVIENDTTNIRGENIKKTLHDFLN